VSAHILSDTLFEIDSIRWVVCQSGSWSLQTINSIEPENVWLRSVHTYRSTLTQYTKKVSEQLCSPDFDHIRVCILLQSLFCQSNNATATLARVLQLCYRTTQSTFTEWRFYFYLIVSYACSQRCDSVLGCVSKYDSAAGTVSVNLSRRQGLCKLMPVGGMGCVGKWQSAAGVALANVSRSQGSCRQSWGSSRKFCFIWLSKTRFFYSVRSMYTSTACGRSQARAGLQFLRNKLIRMNRDFQHSCWRFHCISIANKVHVWRSCNCDLAWLSHSQHLSDLQ
jgi:hypothetical protein